MERSVHTDLFTVCAEGILNFRDIGIKNVGQFLHRRTTLKLLLKVDDGFRKLALETHLIEGHAHDATLFADCLQYALTNPPHRVTDKLEAARLVELLSRLDETQVSLVDEVVKRESLVLILLRNGNDETQVGACESFQCLGVAVVDALRQLHFLVGGDEFFTSDLYKILVKGRTRAVGDAFVDF